MLGIGPMRDMTIGEAVSSAPGAMAGQGSSRGPPQLVACSGQGKQGALAILRRNLVPELILKTATPGQLHLETSQNLCLVACSVSNLCCEPAVADSVFEPSV